MKKCQNLTVFNEEIIEKGWSFGSLQGYGFNSYSGSTNDDQKYLAKGARSTEDW